MEPGGAKRIDWDEVRRRLHDSQLALELRDRPFTAAS